MTVRILLGRAEIHPNGICRLHFKIVKWKECIRASVDSEAQYQPAHQPYQIQELHIPFVFFIKGMTLIFWRIVYVSDNTRMRTSVFFLTEDSRHQWANKVLYLFLMIYQNVTYHANSGLRTISASVAPTMRIYETIRLFVNKELIIVQCISQFRLIGCSDWSGTTCPYM